MATVRTPLLLALAALFVAGCATTEKLEVQVPSGDLDYKPAPPRRAALNVKSRMPQFVLPATVADAKLYSFRATGQPVRLAMSQLATAYKLNIVVDQDVEGLVTVDLHQLPLEKVLEAMLEPIGLAWQWQDGLLRVSRLETRTFTLDYLRLVRSGTGNSTTSTSLASGGGGGGGGSTGNSSSSIAQNDTIDFWDELEEQLDAILERSDDDYEGRDRPMETSVQTDRETNMTTTLSRPLRESAGRLIIDRLSGTIQVTTSRARMRNVVDFLTRVEKGIARQVYIEVKVVEVSLGDDQSLGIDWSFADSDGDWSIGSQNLGESGIGPAGGISGAAATLVGEYLRTISGVDVQVTLEALKQQGQVQVVSQPRIRTLNNQAAIVRVGTDEPFFIRNVEYQEVGDEVIPIETDTLNNVTTGLVLTVTPQISEGGLVTMDVNPVLTRIAGYVDSKDGASSAPVLDIKQSSTLVRVYDGETIVVGGLIQETVSNNKRSVPVIGDIPGIGALFSATYDQDARKELVIFLTPHII